MARGLTEKQEKFCQCVIDGMSYKDSYITAYDYKGKSEQVPYNEGSKLALDERIQQRIEELRQPIIKALETRQLTETERIKAILWEELENARKQQDHTAIARYTDQLNKLNNAYKDTTVTDDSNNDLGGLDTTKLLRIVGTA